MIYLIRAGKPGGPIKVGYTQDEGRLRQRMSNLQCGNHLPLTLVAVNSGGGPVSEAKLHDVLLLARTGGGSEWFRGDAAIVRKLVRAMEANPEMDLIGWAKAQTPRELTPAERRQEHGRKSAETRRRKGRELSKIRAEAAAKERGINI